MNTVTTHVLDLSRGLPAQGVKVELEQKRDEGYCMVGSGLTDDEGRTPNLLSGDTLLRAGIYRLRFYTGEYFSQLGTAALHPFVEIVFSTGEKDTRYHIPLLITPHSYSTYRGS